MRLNADEGVLDMHAVDAAQPGAFCWVDLAASDAARARGFYAAVFGWTFHEQPANGGVFTRARAGGRDVASLYQLGAAQLARGVPSHWTPYVRVRDVQDAALRVAALGGRVVVSPFLVERTARIALVEDPVGALLGLWEAVPQGGGRGPEPSGSLRP